MDATTSSVTAPRTELALRETSSQETNADSDDVAVNGARSASQSVTGRCPRAPAAPSPSCHASTPTAEDLASLPATDRSLSPESVRYTPAPMSTRAR